MSNSGSSIYETAPIRKMPRHWCDRGWEWRFKVKNIHNSWAGSQLAWFRFDSPLACHQLPCCRGLQPATAQAVLLGTQYRAVFLLLQHNSPRLTLFTLRLMPDTMWLHCQLHQLIGHMAKEPTTSRIVKCKDGRDIGLNSESMSRAAPYFKTVAL
jgi:hypothetical protein